MLIGILQTGHAPDPIRVEHGDYDAMFARLLAGRGLAFRTWDVVDGDFPPGPEAAEGWLITGSRHGAYEAHAWIPPLQELIRRIQAARRPLVGICFGHQIVAQALGGVVEKFEGGWSVGHQHYRIDDREMVIGAWHQDQVTRLPPGAEVIGASAGCRYAALLYDGILTVQPHPEFDAAILAGLIEHRGDAVPGDRLEAARQALDRPLDRSLLADRLADFLTRPKQAAADRGVMA